MEEILDDLLVSSMKSPPMPDRLLILLEDIW